MPIRDLLLLYDVGNRWVDYRWESLSHGDSGFNEARWTDLLIVLEGAYRMRRTEVFPRAQTVDDEDEMSRASMVLFDEVMSLFEDLQAIQD